MYVEILFIVYFCVSVDKVITIYFYCTKLRKYKFTSQSKY